MSESVPVHESAPNVPAMHGAEENVSHRIEQKLDMLIEEARSRNEVAYERVRLWGDILNGVQVDGWKLYRVSGSFRSGVSIYGFYRRGEVERKVRISDHVGRWSEFHLDLRNPKSNSAIVQMLRNVSI